MHSDLHLARVFTALDTGDLGMSSAPAIGLSSSSGFLISSALYLLHSFTPSPPLGLPQRCDSLSP